MPSATTVEVVRELLSALARLNHQSAACGADLEEYATWLNVFVKVAVKSFLPHLRWHAVSNTTLADERPTYIRKRQKHAVTGMKTKPIR